MRAHGEIGWLIERGDSPTSDPKYWAAGVYYAEHDPGRSSVWTSNHAQAIRFARKIDAERVAQRLLNGISVRVCEHIWDGAVLSPSPTATGIAGGVV